MWRLVRATGTLDLNSAYLYVLLADRFSGTCAIAEQDGELVGLLTGFVPPEDPETYFVWQIGVAERARGGGLAGRLIDEVLARLPSVRFLEATVAPSNRASLALFTKTARRNGTSLIIQGGYGADLLSAPSGRDRAPSPFTHEPEPLLRVGPLRPSRLISTQEDPS